MIPFSIGRPILSRQEARRETSPGWLRERLDDILLPGRPRAPEYPAVGGFDLFTPIETKRLILRRLAPGDGAALFAYRSDPAVSRYQCWEPRTIGEVESFIDGLHAIGPETPGRWFQLAVVERKSRLMIGDLGIHTPDKDPLQAEVGITVAPAHQGKGYATEALRALLEYLFVRAGRHRVYCSIDPRNHPSIALVERVGMRREGHLVESVRLGDAWADDLIFALLEREWPAPDGGP